MLLFDYIMKWSNEGLFRLNQGFLKDVLKQDSNIQGYVPLGHGGIPEETKILGLFKLKSSTPLDG